MGREGRDLAGSRGGLSLGSICAPPRSAERPIAGLHPGSRDLLPGRFYSPLGCLGPLAPALAEWGGAQGTPGRKKGREDPGGRGGGWHREFVCGQVHASEGGGGAEASPLNPGGSLSPKLYRDTNVFLSQLCTPKLQYRRLPALFMLIILEYLHLKRELWGLRNGSLWVVILGLCVLGGAALGILGQESLFSKVSQTAWVGFYPAFPSGGPTQPLGGRRP